MATIGKFIGKIIKYCQAKIHVKITEAPPPSINFLLGSLLQCCLYKYTYTSCIFLNKNGIVLCKPFLDFFFFFSSVKSMGTSLVVQ